MKHVEFTIEKSGLKWLCSGVCGCCEVQAMSTFIELLTVLMWDKSAK